MIFTIGHSTRTLEAFIALLKGHAVQVLLDVRKMPRSHRNPQFNTDTLPAALRIEGIGYRHLAALGGLRRGRPDSTNTGWRNQSFRAYADYMQTEEFRAGLDECIAIAAEQRAAIMCAEAVPWRCHRSLIADALIARGLAPFEITSGVNARAHKLTPFAIVSGTQVTYPAPAV